MTDDLTPAAKSFAEEAARAIVGRLEVKSPIRRREPRTLEEKLRQDFDEAGIEAPRSGLYKSMKEHMDA